MGGALAAGLRATGASLGVLGTSAFALFLSSAVVSHLNSSDARATSSNWIFVLDALASSGILGLALGLVVPHAARALAPPTDPAATPSLSSGSGSEHQHNENHEVLTNWLGAMLFLGAFTMWVGDSVLRSLPVPASPDQMYFPLRQSGLTADQLDPPVVPLGAARRRRRVSTTPEPNEAHEMTQWQTEFDASASSADDENESGRTQGIPSPATEPLPSIRTRRGPRRTLEVWQNTKLWLILQLQTGRMQYTYKILYFLLVPYDPIYIRPSVMITCIADLCTSAWYIGAAAAAGHSASISLTNALTLSSCVMILLPICLRHLPRSISTSLAPLRLTVPFVLCVFLAYATNPTDGTPMRSLLLPSFVAGMLIYTSVRTMHDLTARAAAVATAALPNQPRTSAHRPRAHKSPRARRRSLSSSHHRVHLLDRLRGSQRRTQSLQLPRMPSTPHTRPGVHSRGQSHLGLNTSEQSVPTRQQPGQAVLPVFLRRRWLRLGLVALGAWAPSWIMWLVHLPGT